MSMFATAYFNLSPYTWEKRNLKTSSLRFFSPSPHRNDIRMLQGPEPTTNSPRVLAVLSASMKKHKTLQQGEKTCLFRMAEKHAHEGKDRTEI